MTSPSDLGPPHRLHPRRLCLRQPNLEHDVRPPPHRLRSRRERGQSLRQDRWSSLGLRGRGREERRGEGEGEGRVFDRGAEGRRGGDLDLLTLFNSFVPYALFT